MFSTSPRTLGISKTPSYKNPLSKPHILQLWVEHGAAISARSAKLLSRCLSAHASASAARAASSLNEIFSYTPRALRPAVASQRVAPARPALAARAAVRARRKAHARRIAEQENERLQARQAQQQAAARVAEQRAAEQREEEKRAEERRAEEERRSQEKRTEERRDEDRRAAEAVSPEQRDGIVVGATAPPAEGATADVKRSRPAPAEDDAKALPTKTQSSARAQQERRPKSNRVGLQRAMIAAGNDPSARGGDKIVEMEGTEADIARVIGVWNLLCDEAEPFRRDTTMKKLRMDIKKQVNLMSNQIAASVKQVSQKVANLCKVLGDASTVGGAPAEAFAIKEIAQRLVQESDGSVALNRTAAFAVGAVIVGVSASVRDPSRMRDAFLGAFYKHCIYTMPAYGRRHKSESLEDYRLRIGYKDGETAEGYMERSCGCLSLFAAVVQTDQVFGPAQGRQNPFPLDLGWTWLARIANREQRTITPAITFAFLEVTGYSMSMRYRKQFTKLMAMVQQAVVMNVVKAAPKGPTSRMDSLVEEFIAAGCVFATPPDGKVLPARDLEFL